MSRNGPEGPSTGTAPPVLMMAGQQRQHERSRLWLRVLGINPHVKGMTARKLLVGALAVLFLKKGCERMNKARLEYEMSVRGVTRAKLCEVLGISRSAFYRKCNGGSEFTQGEIQKIVDFLNLETPVGIFFDAKVS